MAGAAAAAAAEIQHIKELVERITALSELPYNDGYKQNLEQSQVRMERDPILLRNYVQSIEGFRLYNLFNEGEIKEFYEMYVDRNTTPLAKFYFFQQILETKNNTILDPRYEIICSEIKRQLMNPKSDLSQMFINNLILYSKTDEEIRKAILDGTNLALRFIAGLIDESRYVAIREILSTKMVPSKQMGDRMGLGGKRHSKIKRKSKKINRKKSRRRHRRSY